MKSCECGCGGHTTLATRTYTRERIRKGEYRRFLPGHNRRLVGAKRYPTVGTHRHVYAHRARAERALGKPLPAGAQVHHADGSKSADAPLVICQDQWYHALLHARLKVKRLGGDPNTQRWCVVCSQLKPISAFGRSARADGIAKSCKACLCERQRGYKQRWAMEQQEAKPNGASA